MWRKDEGTLASGVKELEAKLLGEMNKPVNGATPPVNSSAVIRAAKSEDYNVYQETN